MTPASCLHSKRTILCHNCWRERLEHDVFWHREHRAWYCINTLACEYRYFIQGEREAAKSRSGVRDR